LTPIDCAAQSIRWLSPSRLLGAMLQWGSSLASSSLTTLKSGAKMATQAVKANAALSAKHTFDDPQAGTHVVTEVCHIAEGGFGMVTKVRDANGEEYALKRIGCQEGIQIASSLEAAETEARILKSLPPHPGIIRCYGSSTDHHGPGSAAVKLLLELCPGGTLLDYMDSKDGKLGAKDVVQPFAQIVSAVGYLHAQKPAIQHRDLKVENVLMGSDSNWKLCDFGSCSTEVIPPQELSRQRFLALQEEIDKTVTMLYRPPEMADIDLNFRNGYQIDTQVDIWMLGCILYTLTFYRHPFQDCPTASAISSGKYFIPEDHPLGKSAKLCGIIHWLLAKDPKDRPKTSRITELLQEIGKCQYADLFNMMPDAVQEKIKKLDALFSKRKDTGDVPLPPAAAALMRAGSGGSSASAPSPAGSSQSRHTQQNRPSNPTKAAQQASSQPAFADFSSSPAPARAADNDAFDLMSVLAPSGPPARDNHVGVAHNKPAAAASAHQEDLLGFGSPPRSAAVAAVPPVDSGDLLGFNAPAVDMFAFNAPATASPANAANADFANFASAPSAAAAVPASADWCDFTSFNSAPAPVMSGGYNSTPMPVAASPCAAASNDLMGFDFADPLAPSPAPFKDPTAQSCGGQARAAATAPADTINLLDLL